MMGIFRSLSGILTIELTSADFSGALMNLNAAGIGVSEVQLCGDLTAVMKIQRQKLRKVKRITAKRGDTLQIIGRQGIYWSGKKIIQRPILLTGMTILLFLAIYLPTRVLFVQVEGNDAVPEKLIMEAAEKSGIGFGASRREVRSEKVKNALLSAVPQLQWAGVNTKGCVAVISVRERAGTESSGEDHSVSSIVADRDGIILEVTVQDGNGLCTVGQAVREGDVLISGFTDCGLCITATQAQGEIIARTRRAMTVKTPSEIQIRGGEDGQSAKYSLILGKKRINFCKGSGIYDSSCVKMYTEYCLTLPGGFRLPVTLVKETVTAYDTRSEEITEDSAQSLLAAFAAEYLPKQMVAGTITDRAEFLTVENGAWILAGEYACIEMIGRVQTEQIGEIP